jgi:hypothetical protein
LNKVRSLVGSIALAAVMPVEDLQAASRGEVHGTQQPWPLRLMIDASLRFPMTGIQVWTDPQTGQRVSTRLDPTALKAVALPETKTEPGDLWARVREVAINLAEEAVFKFDCPELEPQDEHSDFCAYCEELNEQLRQVNFKINHCFAYTLIKEPASVRDKLLELLPALRLFVCLSDDECLPVLHLDERPLAAWIANALTAIEEREERLKDDELPDKPKEEQTMSKNPGDVHQTFNINQMHNSPFNVGEQGTINQNIQYQTADMEKLIQQLQEILDQSDRNNPTHRQVRADVRDMLDAHEKDGKLPENAKGWLEDAKASLGLGDKLLGLVTKALDLWSKIPGAGT